MRTVYLGTSEFAAVVLRRLAGSPHRPALVVTRPDRPRGRGRRLASPPVADVARELGLELDQPDSVNDEAAIARIAAARPEAVCVCAFGGLITEPLLSLYPMLNVHPSLLPRWRGAAPVERAIMAGDERTGVSIMRVGEAFDNGPVCAQASEPIGADDTYGSLAARLEELGSTLLVRTLDESPPCAPQDEALATYAAKIGRHDRELDPARPAAELERTVRALTPHIGAHVLLGGDEWLGVRAARVLPDGPPPGQVSLEGPRPVVGCAEGALELVEVQPPGRRPMAGEDYLRGRRGGEAMPAMKTRGRVSPARACALRVVRRVFEQDAYADRAFAAEAAGLQARDRGLAMALSYGTVQRRATLDYVAAALLDRPLPQLDGAVLAVLRLGLFELLYLGGSARHATVNEGVELAKRVRPHAAGLVNAVLRRAAREGPELLARLDDSTPEAATLRHSVPGWLASQWWRELGGELARELLRVVNQPAESALRVNLLAATPADVAAALPVPTRPAAGLPEGLVFDRPFDAQASELWRSGAVQPQSRASMLVSRILAPLAGQRVLDLCAAPGGKTTHLAALMGNRGEIVAVERHPGRAAALERTVARMRTSCIRVEVGDATTGRPDGPFDRVLADPPCSGLGTLQSRPDLRWRARPEAIGELASLQAGILAAGAAALAPGGMLVYSVCTISRAEGRDVVERFLEEHPDFNDEEWRADGLEMLGVRSGPGVQLLPNRDGTDGFYIARLSRR